jgi:hypothetical protein
MGDQGDQVGRWRDRAEKMRSVAETMQDRSARATLLQAATSWVIMAERAAQRQKQATSPQPAGPVKRRTTVIACRCGARYSRKIVVQPERFKDSFECVICHAAVECWRGDGAPFKLISRGEPKKP